MNKKTIGMIIAIILCAALLASCGNGDKPGNNTALPPQVPTVSFSAGDFPADSESITVALKTGETALLDSFSRLSSADLSGSEDIDGVLQWAQSHPEVRVTYTVLLPDGSTVKSDLTSVDLSGITDNEAGAWARALEYLPGISYVSLGTQRSGLSWDGVHEICSACPNADIDYAFTLYGTQHFLGDTRIDLNHIPVEDEGEEIRLAMGCMKNLVGVDMDSCGVSNEAMARIRDEFPDVKVVWRIWFGQNYTARTDVERILASMPSHGGMLEPGNYESLMYCTDVKYLDVGHNDLMSDIGFVRYMPKLEVAILAMANWSDASPLAYCKNLEYLEIQTTQCADLSPLAELTNLRHLDIAYCPNINDISPLYGLTELERLWIGCLDPVPQEQVAQMQRCAPNCEINTEVYDDPTGGRWRYVDYNELAYVFILHDRYALLREQFDNYASSAFNFTWNDPLY